MELLWPHASADRALMLHFLQIVWDVGHQAYGHKILTGRRSRMPTIRQTGGLSGRNYRLCAAEAHPVLQTALSRRLLDSMQVLVITGGPVIMQPTLLKPVSYAFAGFTKRDESEYDPFGAGHSSTSISAALGMAVARDFKVWHASWQHRPCSCHSGIHSALHLLDVRLRRS